MKLAAIYNLWDGEELLLGSMKCLKDHVDLFIIVWQEVSNFGEPHNPLDNLNFAGFPIALVKYNPPQSNGAPNEINKRNLGLEIARGMDCTHFLHIDADEYYHDFAEAKQAYINSGAAGSVCPLYTYFKKPTWRCDEPDGYYVPFIHQLTDKTTSGVTEYPFYVDPTRRINEKDVVLLPHYMHHYSWVRKDIGRKTRNSTARNNIAAGTLMQDYNNPALEYSAAGHYIKDWDRKLMLVEDTFGIGGMVV